MSSPVAPVSLTELQAPVRLELERVQRELRRIIEADFQLIREVNAHLLQMQGKLFRPTIMLLADQATGATTGHAVTLAAVVGADPSRDPGARRLGGPLGAPPGHADHQSLCSAIRCRSSWATTCIPGR